MSIDSQSHIIGTPEEISKNCSPILSPDLQKDIQGKEIVRDGIALDNTVFSMYRRHSIAQLLQKEKQEGRRSYHNTNHALAVYGGVEELLTIKRMLGERGIIRESSFAPYEEQILYFAALFHDWVRNEKASAIAFDAFLKSIGASLYQRVLGQGLIMGTTYPRKNISKEVGDQRDYTPQTDMERILAIADIGGYKLSWEEWIDESARVLQEGTTRPKTLLEWLKNQFSFLQYVCTRQTPESLVYWGLQLDEKKKKLSLLVDIIERGLAIEDPVLQQAMQEVRKKIEPLLVEILSHG